MKKVALFDTSIGTENIGDKIIMDYCNKIANEIFGDSFFVNIPTHDIIGKSTYNSLSICDYKIMCGTNLLSSNMNKYNQWKIKMIDSFYLNDICLLGVGWWQYQEKPNIYTRILYKRILSNKLLHSVRDNYTLRMLKSIGIENVINTACPTMWGLTTDLCEDIPTYKGKDVLVTVTDYNKDEISDKYMFKIIKRNYDKVYVWIQALEDYSYIKKLINLNDIIVIPPTIRSLDDLLRNNNSIDYVGTRLHAGIRALNHKKRTIIIGVDNRALEISKDCNIEVIKREDVKYKLEKKIQSKFVTSIKLPLEEIYIWKSQFTR